jgi:tyrosinase-like protein
MRGRSRWLATVGVTAVIAGAVLAASTAGASAAQRATTVRKSASQMTRAEVDRFRRAFSYAVRKGYFDVFNDEHYDHMRNRQHGVDVLAGAPPAVAPGESAAWGYRLLPWHRAFLIEAERMLRAALRKRDRAEGRNPREADRLFIPYWDAANDQRLPRWVRAFKPKGGTAIVPPDVPKGHAAYGKPVGSRYRIRFGRWPGGNLVFDRLQQPDQISRMLAQDSFDGFYKALDVVSEVVPSALPAAKLGLQTLAGKVPGNPDVQTVIAAADPNYPKDAASQLAAFNALLGVGYLATSEAARDAPDQELIAAVKAVYAAFRFPPHITLHFWAGGLNPDNPDVRGTVTYFNELTVDPVFWMLHAELDRYWYTWRQSHDEAPPLQGEDAVFQPLRRREGAWYGGGRRYLLSELNATRDLPYRYDSVFRGPAARASVRLAAPLATAPAISNPAGFVCRLPSSLGPTIRNRLTVARR